MSWTPSPSYGSANWQGNAQLATKNQLLSTSSGFYEDLKDFNFSTISVSTLTVPLWISTPILYVSDIQGANIDISGITIDSKGIFNAPVISVSSMNLKGFELGLDVSFDFGLGQAIGGVVGGLGAAVGGGLIAVGTGAGLAIQGAATGAATLIAGRPQNFISQTNYETINFTTQLQVSTLGYASPVYSTIFRTVSSVSADQVPGREIFTSSFFYPGQICVRAVSDPFNLISGDSNLNTSTIQSFGQWTALAGLEPENVIANSVSTNYLSTNGMFAGVADVDFLEAYSGVFSNVAVVQQQSVNYNAPITFKTGSGNFGSLIGDLNRFYLQTTNGFIFSDYGSSTEGGSLYIGSNADESLLNVSSIFSRGSIQANSAYFSSIVAETLTVVSTINLTSTNVENVTSTATLQANTAYIEEAYISSISSFRFNTLLGNPTGPFDITKEISYTSTSYNQTSSLTNNILSYTMTANLQDQTSFNLNIAETPFGVQYTVTKANVAQWGSTIMIFNDYQNSGTVTVDFPAIFSTNQLTGTFDLQTQYSPDAPAGYVEQIYVIQKNPSGQGFSTIAQNASGDNPPLPVALNNWRFEIGPTGWVESVENNPAPYETINSNIFTVTQDINDVTLTTSDRLNFTAGEIVFNGTVNLNTTSVANQFAVNLTASNAYISTLSTGFLTASNITVNPLTGGLNTFYYKSTISWNSNPTQVTPLEMTFKFDSPDFLPQYSLLAPFIGNNYFNSYNVSSWNNSLWANNVAFSLGKPVIYCGDLQAPLGTYTATFYINNNLVLSPAYALPVYSITSAGSNLIGNIAGGAYGQVSTSNGVTWTLTSGIPNPQGVTGGSFSNNMVITQQYQQTSITNTQNISIQAPNTQVITNTLGLYADQIRVNSRVNGTLPNSGLPSFPIGFENTVYEDNGMIFTQYGVTGVWYSDATNVVSNINQTTYYDANSWIIQVIPSRFRFPDTCAIYGWDVQPSIFAVGGGGYAWGYTRYVTVSPNPGITGNNWNWILAIPKNYCTSLT